MSGLAGDIYNILCFVILGQLLLLSVFLLTHRKGRRISNGLLAAFLSAKAVGIVNVLIFRYEVQTPHVYLVLVPFAFLWGPALYLYVRSLAYKDFRLRAVHFLHLLPFVLSAAYFTLVFHARSTAVKASLLESMRNGLSREVAIFTILILSQVGCYLLAAVCVLWRFRRELKFLFSSIERIGLPWLSFVLFGFIAVWAVDAANFVLHWIGKPVPPLGFLVMVLLFIFANFIVFYGLRQPALFNGIEERKKYRHSKLTKAESKEYLVRLKAHMEKEKPYLDPALSITDLARSLSIPSRFLSQVINESLGLNFFDFVNSYRIDEAKKRLRDPATKGGNILDLLLEAGFQTKSVFNRVFKKYTGMTPTEFRRRLPD